MFSPDKFKDRLKDAMKGESNYSFGEKCDISEGTLRRYLRGDTFPPLDTLAKIAEVSGCSLAWLASGEIPAEPVMVPLEEDVLEWAIIEVMKGQHVSDGDTVKDLIHKAISKAIATYAINVYKEVLEIPTTPKDKILNKYNTMISDLTNNLNKIADAREKEGK